MCFPTIVVNILIYIQTRLKYGIFCIQMVYSIMINLFRLIIWVSWVFADLKCAAFIQSIYRDRTLFQVQEYTSEIKWQQIKFKMRTKKQNNCKISLTRISNNHLLLLIKFSCWKINVVNSPLVSREPSLIAVEWTVINRRKVYYS